MVKVRDIQYIIHLEGLSLFRFLVLARDSSLFLLECKETWWFWFGCIYIHSPDCILISTDLFTTKVVHLALEFS